MRQQPRGLAATVGVLALTVLLPACGPTIVNHGYRLDQARVDQIRPGVTTRQEVADIMGSPSSVSSFGDPQWFYISQRAEKKVWTNDKILSQDVLIVTFDTAGVVSQVGTRDLAQAEKVTPDADKTVTAGKDLSVFQEFFGNLGRFNLPEGGSDGVGNRRPPGGF